MKTLGKIRISGDFIIVITGYEADFAVEFSEQTKSFGKAAERYVAKVINTVIFANLRVPAGNDASVHFFDTTERAAAVFDDAMVKKMSVRREEYCHTCFS